VRVATFVQARMGSRRLAGKSMLPIWREMPLIELVLRRVAAARSPAPVVLATSRAAADDPLAEVALELGMAVFRGSEADVLDRFARALDAHPADAVVRVCADNPFVEAQAIDELVAFFRRGQPCDYASNHTRRSGLPDGVGAEIVSADALRYAAANADAPFEREHITSFILARRGHFSVAYAPAPKRRLPRAKLDIDTPADYEAMRRLAERLPLDGAPVWDRHAIIAAWREMPAPRRGTPQSAVAPASPNRAARSGDRSPPRAQRVT
jgi:spore coat polysaccharide biosynthesis protein SpsF (cytidylyltransferase family)